MAKMRGYCSVLIFTKMAHMWLLRRASRKITSVLATLPT